MKGQIMLITLIMSVFFLGCASADVTNNTTVNTTSVTQTAVEPLATGVRVSVDPTSLNLGTVDPDGRQREYYNATRVSINTTGGTLRFSVRASGDLIGINNSSNIIPLSNLNFSIKYDSPYGLIQVPPRSFTTTSYIIWTYTGPVRVVIPINYYITVPLYTNPDTYRVTITYVAV